MCVCLLTSQKPHVQISPDFRYMSPVAVVLSSSDDNSISSIRPTSCLPVIGQAMATPVVCMFKVTAQGAARIPYRH